MNSRSFRWIVLLNSPRVLRQLEPLVIELFPGYHATVDVLSIRPGGPTAGYLRANPIRIVRSLPLPWNLSLT